MNDLEQRLKDMLDADASKAPTVQGAPERLRPKVRRRQIGTALVGSLTALALVAVSVAGFRALDAPETLNPPTTLGRASRCSNVRHRSICSQSPALATCIS